MINTAQVMVLNSIVAFAGDYLISASFDKTLRIWSLKVISSLTHFSSSPTGFSDVVCVWLALSFLLLVLVPFPPGFAQVFNGTSVKVMSAHIVILPSNFLQWRFLCNFIHICQF